MTEKDAIGDLIVERECEHGDWSKGARVASKLMRVLDDHGKSLDPEIAEALRGVLGKCARILAGNEYNVDHYVDVEGYARLARRHVERRNRESAEARVRAARHERDEAASRAGKAAAASLEGKPYPAP